MAASRRIRSSVRRAIIRKDDLLRSEIEDEMEQIGETIRLELVANTLTWKNKPKFTKKLTIRRTLLAVDVTVDKRTKAGKIFTYVSGGTGKWGKNARPYKIRAKTRNGVPGKLKFQTNYIPKTEAVKPNAHIAKANVGPGVAIGPWRQADEVEHPGIEPRHFVEVAVNGLQPSFRKRIENAIRRAVRRA